MYQNKSCHPGPSTSYTFCQPTRYRSKLTLHHAQAALCFDMASVPYKPEENAPAEAPTAQVGCKPPLRVFPSPWRGKPLQCHYNLDPIANVDAQHVTSIEVNFLILRISFDPHKVICVIAYASQQLPLWRTAWGQIIETKKQKKNEVKRLKALRSSVCLRIVSCVTVDECKFTRIYQSVFQWKMLRARPRAHTNGTAADGTTVQYSIP
jgi:hypothetical protein